jgi:hypothetical protein
VRPLPPERDLEELFGDGELFETAQMLRAVRAPEPPLDPAFRAALRRRLMQEAWTAASPRMTFWKRLFAPQSFAWAGAAIGVVLIALTVTLSTQRSQDQRLLVSSPLDQARNVAVEQPIAVNFNQPVDHAAVESAISIQPATAHSYEWKGNTLYVKPASGQLAANTQYQVRLMPQAASRQPLPAKTITFVTAPTPAPKPTAAPSNHPVQPITAEKQLANATGTRLVGWSPDGGTLYYLNAAGQLHVVAADGSGARTLPVDGVRQAAVSPDGTQLVFNRAATLGVVSADGKMPPVETPVSDVLNVGWQQPLNSAAPKTLYVQGNAVWSTATGIAAGPAKVASLGETPVAAYFSPNGDHLVYRGAGGGTHLVDLSDGREAPWNQSLAGQLAWSSDGRRVLFTTSDGLYISDASGASAIRLAALADLSAKSDTVELAWSSHDQILLSTPSGIWTVRSDGTGLRKLQDGEFAQPTWNAAGTAIAYRRGGSPWDALVNLQNASPTASLDEAYGAVNDFMAARKQGQTGAASAFLDANARGAYGGSAEPDLVISGDPALSRYFVVFAQAAAGQPATSYRFVVRLVLGHGLTDVSDYDETLVLQRNATGKLLIHQATAGPRQSVGKGPRVLSVQLERGLLRVTFDSDMDAASVGGGVTVKDAAGKSVVATPSYANRVDTIMLQPLTAGSTYHLAVGTGVKDISGRAFASEFDLDLVGLAA